MKNIDQIEKEANASYDELYKDSKFLNDSHLRLSYLYGWLISSYTRITDEIKEKQ